jgi:hypothetical protein
MEHIGGGYGAMNYAAALAGGNLANMLGSGINSKLMEVFAEPEMIIFVNPAQQNTSLLQEKALMKTKFV